MVQKSVALKFKAPIWAMSVDIDTCQSFDGRQGLTTAGSEGGKVVFAQQMLGSFLHRFFIEGTVNPTRTTSF
jgi:hypothetical protein